MAKPILDKARVIFTWRMSSAMAVRALLKSALLMNWVFIIVNTLKMLGSGVKVRMHACTHIFKNCIIMLCIYNSTPTMFLYFPRCMYRWPCDITSG